MAKISVFIWNLNWNFSFSDFFLPKGAVRTTNAYLSRSSLGWSILYPFLLSILTFRTGRFICFVPRHHVIKAAGFDPELLHSISYVLSAETNARFAKIWTAAGFTVHDKKVREKKR